MCPSSFCTTLYHHLKIHDHIIADRWSDVFLSLQLSLFTCDSLSLFNSGRRDGSRLLEQLRQHPIQTHSLTFRTTPDCRHIIFSSLSYQRRTFTFSIDQPITSTLHSTHSEIGCASTHLYFTLSLRHPTSPFNTARSRAVPKLIVYFLLSISGYLKLITTPSWSAQSHCYSCLSEPNVMVRGASLSPSRRRRMRLSFLERLLTLYTGLIVSLITASLFGQSTSGAVRQRLAKTR
jgi:hypothetical protein